MKIVEQYVFEEGDLFTGKGDSALVVSNQRTLYAAERHYLFVKETGFGAVYLCGEGSSYNFAPEELTDYIKRGILIYLGNVYKGKN